MAAGESPYVLRTRAGGLLTLAMNRGERFNPLSASMIAALEQALDDAAQDGSVRVIVLRGEGRGFCAGHDLREIRRFAGNLEWERGLFESCNRMMLKLTRLPQPVIASVHGVATAAGCQLMSLCDLAVAEASARFALPGVNLGLFCSTPAVGVVRSIGRKRTMEMLLTGDSIDAPTAERWGLVNRVVGGDELVGETQRWVDRILDRSAATIALGKKTFYAQIEAGLPGALAMAGEAMVCNLGLADAAEGIDAFLAKRSPHWRDA